MAGILGAVRDFLANLFGGGNDTQRRLTALTAMEDRISEARRDNEEGISVLKDEIRLLETRARQKKREYDQARGDSQRIVGGEIDRIFCELDRCRGRENIVAANLERISVALAKVGEAKAALRAGVSEEQFDDIALEIQDLFGTLKTLDRAATDLDREKYEALVASNVDVEKRMAEVLGDEKAPPALSPETVKRLKQLETE